MERGSRPAEVLEIHELRYGKPVRSRSGPVARNAQYGTVASTPGVSNPLMLLPDNLINDRELGPSKIDPQFADRGALVVVSVESGLAALRLRFRPEAGEGEGGRQYMLSTTVVLRGVDRWASIPPGFFAWCERELDAEVHLENESSVLPPRRLSLPKWWHPDPTWLSALPEWRQGQLGSAFSAIELGKGWLAAHPPADAAEQRPGQLLAADLDYLASLELDIPLRRLGEPGYIFSIGIDPALIPGAICFLPARPGALLESIDLDKLRRAIEGAVHAETASPSASGIMIVDSLARLIGRESIPLPPS